MKLETSIAITGIITTLIKDNVDMVTERKGLFNRTIIEPVKFDSFKPISELLTNNRRSEVMTMLSRILGIEIWATDYVSVENTIKTKDMAIGLNLNTNEICNVLSHKIERDL